MSEEGDNISEMDSDRDLEEGTEMGLLDDVGELRLRVALSWIFVQFKLL